MTRISNFRQTVPVVVAALARSNRALIGAVAGVVAVSFAAACASPVGAGSGRGDSHATRSGVLEFEPNGHPTDQIVERVREEIDSRSWKMGNFTVLP
jgi:hypothetical protein